MFDYAQYIAAVGVGDVLTDMLVDTEGSISIMDLNYARS